MTDVFRKNVSQTVSQVFKRYLILMHRKLWERKADLFEVERIVNLLIHIKIDTPVVFAFNPNS